MKLEAIKGSSFLSWLWNWSLFWRHRNMSHYSSHRWLVSRIKWKWNTQKVCVLCECVSLSHMFMFGACFCNRHIITEYVKVYLAGFSEVQHPTHLQWVTIIVVTTENPQRSTERENGMKAVFLYPHHAIHENHLKRIRGTWHFAGCHV